MKNWSLKKSHLRQSEQKRKGCRLHWNVYVLIWGLKESTVYVNNGYLTSMQLMQY